MRSRRAISSVVGMVFAIIALTTTITYISYSMGVLNNYNQSVLVKNQQLTDAGKEMFQISSVTVPNGKLNVTVADTGNLPINFTKIWIQNTTATDWTHSYVPTNNFVSPGGILTNVGQSIPMSINPAYSYNVKLVTSRGNTQQFTVNSISSTKLNVQLAAFPPNVDSGLSSQIVMIVTNNSTGPIVNLIPAASVSPTPPGPPICALGSASPSVANTLLPGETVVFTWPLTATGTSGQVCTVTAQLANGQTVQTTVTITQVSLTTATYADAAGTLTMNYTDFQYTEGGNWSSGWNVPGNSNVAFTIKITNNNATSDFKISKQSFFWFTDTTNGAGGNSQQYYLVKSVNLSPLSLNAYCNGSGDFCTTIPHGGGITGTATLYFGAGAPESGGFPNKNLATGEGYAGFIVLYGEFVDPNTGYTVQYGQNLPFVAILASNN